MEELRATLTAWWHDKTIGFVHWLRRHGITPNQVSLAGTAVAVSSAPLFADGWLSLGALVFALGSLADAIDGELARLTQQTSRFGAFLDSMLDRVAEAVPLAGVAVYLAERGEAGAVAVVVLALLGGNLTSYVRARAESLGIECKVGWVSRPERAGLMAVLLFVQLPVLMVWLLAIGSLATVVQRVLHVRSRLGSEPLL